MDGYVRVTASRNYEDVDDILHFDLRLEDARASGRLPIFGWQKDHLESKPLVVLSDGQVDFGTVYEPDRYGDTDLLKVLIEIGQDIRCWGHDWNFCLSHCLYQNLRTVHLSFQSSWLV